MAVVVENGTGLANADSYVSVAEADAYATAYGNTTWAGATAPEKEAALRRATRYVDGRYAGRWPGYKLNGRTQALAWPRKSVLDSYGGTVASNEVPREIVSATIEVALREQVDPGALAPDFIPGQRVVSESVGNISVTYADEGGGSTLRPTVIVVDEILWPLLLAGGTSVATLLRA